MSTMYIVYVISIQVSDSAQCECEDVSPYWLLVGISHFAIPCWYVTWALIEKFLFGISSRSQKVLGPKDEINSGFAILLDVPICLVQVDAWLSENLYSIYYIADCVCKRLKQGIWSSGPSGLNSRRKSLGSTGISL